MDIVTVIIAVSFFIFGLVVGISGRNILKNMEITACENKVRRLEDDLDEAKKEHDVRERNLRHSHKTYKFDAERKIELLNRALKDSENRFDDYRVEIVEENRNLRDKIEAVSDANRELHVTISTLDNIKNKLNHLEERFGKSTAEKTVLEMLKYFNQACVNTDSADNLQCFLKYRHMCFLILECWYGNSEIQDSMSVKLCEDYIESKLGYKLEETIEDMVAML